MWNGFYKHFLQLYFLLALIRMGFLVLISDFHGAKWLIFLIFLTFATCSERLSLALGLKKYISWSWKNRFLITHPHPQYTYTHVSLGPWVRDLTCVLKSFPWLRLTGPWSSLPCLANMTCYDCKWYFTNRKVAQVLWGGKCNQRCSFFFHKVTFPHQDFITFRGL